MPYPLPEKGYSAVALKRYFCSMNFRDITYLQNGSRRQQEAYDLLAGNRLLQQLSAYDPILAGTIPLTINIENSDLDIICYFRDQPEFIQTVTALFKRETGFVIRVQEQPEGTAVIANFCLGSFDIEIFGQNIPVQQQYAYRHMLTEHALLCRFGEALRQQVITLKRRGYKTEPAFALALGLEGDPYTILLDPGIAGLASNAG